jgi:hypothetical protein
MNYKCRAECHDDAQHLAEALRAAQLVVRGWTVTTPDPGFPDVLLSFACDEPIDVVRHVIATIADGHVMYETLAEAESYTGERTYVGPMQAN